MKDGNTHESGELRTRLLGELYRSPVCLSLGDLAERVETRPQTAWTVLKRLEADGFTERVERGCWTVTEAGRGYVLRLRAHLASK